MTAPHDGSSPLTRPWGQAPHNAGGASPATTTPPVAPADPIPASTGGPPYRRPSQARTALALSLFGLFCCGLAAIIGGIMGRRELNAINRGESDPSAYGSAQAAFLIGMAAGILWLLVVLIWVLAVGASVMTG